MGMIHFCDHFLLNYFFNDYCRIKSYLGTNWLAFKAWTIHILPLASGKQKLVF